MPPYKTLETCRACDLKVVPLLDLGNQPLANSYHTSEQVLPSYPLAVNRCTKCFHVQQAVAVDPDLMFKEYAYVSGTSATLRAYFDWFADMVNDRHLGADKTVLEIACNDGSQLAAFGKLGWKLYGVDPAENLLALSRATGATVLCDYWTPESAQTLDRTFDAVVAENVLAHTADPLDFLKACNSVMHKNSKLYIQTSQADMLVNGEFDTIYHEHISFFSALSFRTLAHRAGFTVEDVLMTPIHGGSYVFVLGFGSDEKIIDGRIAKERAEGRYAPALYERFASQAHSTVTALKKTLRHHEKSGYAAVGFGAAAKGNTLLNFGAITLEYIVDENPLKHGLYTPGMNIPIVPPQSLSEDDRPLAILVLAWNFFDEIEAKIRARRPRGKDVFLRCFPELSVS